MEERRKYPRAPVNRPCRIRLDGSETDTQLINISEVGAAAYYSRQIVSNTPVELGFELNTSGGEDAPLLLRGYVRHAYQRGQSFILGIEFTGVPPRELSIIRSYVKRRSTEA